MSSRMMMISARAPPPMYIRQPPFGFGPRIPAQIEQGTWASRAGQEARQRALRTRIAPARDVAERLRTPITACNNQGGAAPL
jgi:hypothetical protein